MSTTRVDWGTRDFGVLEPATTAWKRIREDLFGILLPIIGAFFVLGVVGGIFGGVAGGLQSVAEQSEEPETLLAVAALFRLMGQLTNQLISAFITPGIIIFTLKVWRGENYQFGDIFSGGRYFGWMLLLNLLMGLAITIGCCLLIVPGVYLALSFALAPQLIVDQNLNAIDAMKVSYEKMNGLRGSLLGFWVVFGLLGALLIVVTCFLGSFVVGPVGWLAQAYVYLKATNGGGRGAPVDANVFA